MGLMGKRKQIKIDNNIDNKKKLSNRGASDRKVVGYGKDPDGYWNETPKWAFSRSDKEMWKIHDDFMGYLLEKLIDFEKMTWGEILRHTRNGKSSNNTSSHNISRDNLIKDAQNRLEELNIYEDELFSLSLDNRKRLWGILDSGVLRIIWYDPKHEICPSNKKHT